MKRIFTGILVALLLAAGVAVFAAIKDGPAAKETSASGVSTDDPKVSQKNSQPVLPTVSVPADAKEAKLLMEINQVIFQVTQEALQRPKDQRMTAEEISALVRSRVKELQSGR
jgi:hypothetical protein